MRIKIIKGNGWYEDEVGNEFDVIRFMDDNYGCGYVVNETENGSADWVDVEDCVVIE